MCPWQGLLQAGPVPLRALQGAELLLRRGVGAGASRGARGHPGAAGAGAGPQGPGLHRLPGAAPCHRGTAAGTADHPRAAGLRPGKRAEAGLEPCSGEPGAPAACQAVPGSHLGWDEVAGKSLLSPLWGVVVQ
ncbi:hypothetical protein EK904_006742 [Melospiza melodia maxima]|nr:hypothetical protein EK904_006742 [Melospiza melodia maxima]